MSTRLSIRRAWAGFALAMVATPLAAQQRVLLDWSGRVDSVARITIQGGGARVSLVGAQANGAGNLRVRSELPHRDGHVTVQVAEGRGDVVVVEQPTSENDYTAVLRIRDRSGGIDIYRITALWAPGVVNSEESYGEIEHAGRADVRNVGLLHWSGDVDRTLVVRWRGDRAMLQTVSGDDPRNVRADVSGIGLPARDVTLRIIQRQGRGNVVIEQQPSSGNNYTAVIRINDPEGGYGHYEFDVVFDRREP